jgi:DNA repair protein RecO (recombination protein O)
MSSKSAALTDQAFILHSRPYRNTSLLLEVFSAQHGRLSLLAKGARTPKSPLYAVLQPFHSLFMSWGGRGELLVLYKAEALAVPQELSGEQLFNGFYLNELLVRLLHKHDAHPGLFQLYAETLQQLTRDTPHDVTLRYFEIQLLEELGYGLNLTLDVSTQQPVSVPQTYHYRVEQGPVPAVTTQTNLLTLSGGTLLALANRQLHDLQQRQEAKRLMRVVLDHHLGNKPLKTRELYQPVR